MSKRLPWLPFYFGDYLRTTVGWPPVARLCYVELLALQWDRGELPTASDDLRPLVAGVTMASWSTAWPLLEREFPIVGDARQNPALEALRSKQTAIKTSRQAAAKTAATARWRNRTGVDPDPKEDA